MSRTDLNRRRWLLFGSLAAFLGLLGLAWFYSEFQPRPDQMPFLDRLHPQIRRNAKFEAFSRDPSGPRTEQFHVTYSEFCFSQPPEEVQALLDAHLTPGNGWLPGGSSTGQDEALVSYYLTGPLPPGVLMGTGEIEGVAELVTPESAEAFCLAYGFSTPRAGGKCYLYVSRSRRTALSKLLQRLGF